MLIPESEIEFDFARSSGPGGQNVNKVETKVIAHWPVGDSAILTNDEKARVREKLANRLNNADEIVLAVEEERSQPQNKAIAIERLNNLVAEALLIPKLRRPTRPRRGAVEKRLAEKARLSSSKQARRMPNATEVE